MTHVNTFNVHATVSVIHVGFSEMFFILLVFQVCSGTDNNFVVINQKGIDPPSLDLLARAGVSHGTIMFCSLVIQC